MKKMMGLNSQAAAEKEFESLASWLSTISHDSEKSLREAGAELLTVHSLGLTGAFRNSMASTNIIESLIGVVKSKTKKVKNWNYHPRSGANVKRDKALRWTATAIQAHRPKMRRVYGGKEQMNVLINRLNTIDSIKIPA